MMVAVEFDNMRERFQGIIKYRQLQDPTGYKFTIEHGSCYLDPPSVYQRFTRWYYGHSKEKFQEFLVEMKPKLLSFLELVKNSGLVESTAYQANHIISQIMGFVFDLSRACSICRTVYPHSEEIRTILLSYFHEMNSWMREVGF